MMTAAALFLLAASAAASIGHADGFAIAPTRITRSHASAEAGTRFRPSATLARIGVRLHGSGGGGNFDVTKEQFDLYSLRNVRGDALIRYNSLNQSEPLRINLYLLAVLTFFSYPGVSEAVFGEPATPAGTAAAAAAGAFSAYRFVRECGRRNQKLSRMEKELGAGRLTVRIPNGPFADRPYGDAAFDLGQLRGKRRILAVRGSAEQLREALVPFRALRRRFAQASVLVVAVPTDGSVARDWGIEDEEIKSVKYLAQPGDAEEWVDYFASLVGDDNKDLGGQLAWFGLSNSGKSFGSGVGGALRPIEILGQSLLPLEMLSEDDKDDVGGAASDDVVSILGAQKQFYQALTEGDKDGMERIYSKHRAAEVDEVVAGGGRIDGWDKCLADDARPSGMKTSGSDVLVVSSTEAFSTTIEFPPVQGVDDATLLAVQKWTRESAAAADGGGWKLELHQTIPWAPDTRAGATLRCDCRGCTALTRAPDRQYNFRGMID